jgi:hypothetical protein
VTAEPNEGTAAAQWVEVLWEQAGFRVEYWMSYEDPEMLEPDMVAEHVVRVDPAASEQVVLWFGQRLHACRDAVTNWRFVTAERIKKEFMEALGKWLDAEP